MDFLKNNGLRPINIKKNKYVINHHIHKLITIDKFIKKDNIKKIKKKPKINKKEYVTNFVNYHYNNNCALLFLQKKTFVIRWVFKLYFDGRVDFRFWWSKICTIQ